MKIHEHFSIHIFPLKQHYAEKQCGGTLLPPDRKESGGSLNTAIKNYG